MKEKEVHLTVEEIDYLLKGSIHWDDIEFRVDAPSRKPIETRKQKSPLEQSELGKFSAFTESERVNHLEPTLGDSLITATKPFLQGNGVYWVLSGVGIITLGTWAYFVFAG